MKLKKLETKIREGKGSFKDVHDFAEGFGKEAAERIRMLIKEEFPNGELSDTAVRRIVSFVLQDGYKTISELSGIVINKMYEKVGVGLKAIAPEYSKYREDEIIAEILREYSDNESA